MGKKEKCIWKAKLLELEIRQAHLYIFTHIKIGQAQVHNSRGHTSNVMPSRVVQQWYRTLPDRLSSCLQPTPLLSPWFSQIYSNMP